MNGAAKGSPASGTTAARSAGARPGGIAVTVAEPHGFCAGVRRAIAMAEEALGSLPPGGRIYCLHGIVHNGHVTARLARRGMVFVESTDAVPDGARLFFSAHGAGPGVRAEAARRGMAVTDATCPFVARLHEAVRRCATEGRHVAVVGTHGHDETEGAVAEAPGLAFIVQDIAEAEALALPQGARLAILSQTSLPPERFAPIARALRRRHPAPAGRDGQVAGRCTASAERQEAVRELAKASDAVVVIGSESSANANRLRDVAREAGARAVLLEDLAAVKAWAADGGLDGVARLGLTSAASTPEDILDDVRRWLEGTDAPAGATRRRS